MLSRLSISLKLFFSNLVYAVPVIVMIYFIVATKNEGIDFAQGELKGDRYQASIEKIFLNLAFYGVWLQRQSDSNPLPEQKLREYGQQVDLALEELRKVDAEIGADLQFTEAGLAQRKREHSRYIIFKKEWEDLKAIRQDLKSEERLDRHFHLVSDLRTMITHLGDTSNLILDPDLDSYYLMDITLATLPQMQDRIQEIYIKTERLLQKGTFSQQDRIQMAVYAALLKQSDWDRFSNDMQTVLNEDKNFYGTNDLIQKSLSETAAKAKGPIESLIALLNQFASESPTPAQAEKFIEVAESALDQAYVLSEKLIPALDSLLETRIEVQTGQKQKAITWSVVALFIAAVLSTLIGLNIKTSVVSNIADAVTKVKAVSKQIQHSNRSLLTTSETLSNGTSQQASAIQESVSSLNEINAMVSKSVDNAERSSKESDESEKVAKKGKIIIQEMHQRMNRISQSNAEIMVQIEESNTKFADIVQVITEIGAKTKVIHDIVFQTKLLSFNASVEAARAGEHGKGFAVVAEEVGNLAQMSGSAAKEIGDMLDGSIQKVNNIIQETQTKIGHLIARGKDDVKAGVEVVQECSEVFEEVTRHVEDVNIMMAEILEASKQQAIGVDEITRAMNQLDAVTHQNSTSSKQTADLAVHLTSHALELSQVVHLLETKVSSSSVSPDKQKQVA